ncbi:MAG TPA: hypothetical protein PKY82_17540 [Pyrinomonadaceae bacterium]|nr:hypothetical protein [Pyrinomonadaceae bacterium]
MARVLIVKPTGGLFTVLYTVEKVVGIGGFNSRDDVFLVQFFLRVAMEEDKARGGDRFLPPGERPISIDGSFGRQTASYIKFFQEEGNRRAGLSPVSSQRIDPFTGSFRGLKTGSLLTIAALNFDYMERQGKGFHSNISLDPRFPNDLKKSLFV